MATVKKIAFALVVIGGLNWGLVGLLDFDLVAWIFGEKETISRVIYTLVCLSAIVVLLPGDKKE